MHLINLNLEMRVRNAGILINSLDMVELIGAAAHPEIKYNLINCSLKKSEYFCEPKLQIQFAMDVANAINRNKEC